MLLEIVQYGNPVLKEKCRPVEHLDASLKDLANNMLETMYAAEGVGLAAPQVGILRRAVVVVNGEDELIELVNPEIIFAEGEQTGPEGCLSVPGKFGMVSRPYHVKVRAQDRFGNWFEAEGEELTARCFCHELEHLDGHLYVEHIDHFLTEEELNDYYREQGYDIEEDEE